MLTGVIIGDDVHADLGSGLQPLYCYRTNSAFPQCTLACPAWVTIILEDKDKDKVKFDKDFKDGMAKNVNKLVDEFPDSKVKIKQKPPKPKDKEAVYLKICTGELIEITDVT